MLPRRNSRPACAKRAQLFPTRCRPLPLSLAWPDGSTGLGITLPTLPHTQNLATLARSGSRLPGFGTNLAQFGSLDFPIVSTKSTRTSPRLPLARLFRLTVFKWVPTRAVSALGGYTSASAEKVTFFAFSSAYRRSHSVVNRMTWRPSRSSARIRPRPLLMEVISSSSPDTHRAAV